MELRYRGSRSSVRAVSGVHGSLPIAVARESRGRALRAAGAEPRGGAARGGVPQTGRAVERGGAGLPHESTSRAHQLSVSLVHCLVMFICYVMSMLLTLTFLF